MQPWTIKYAPKNSTEILGQRSTIASLKDFIRNFKINKKKAVLLHGPSGSGKTSSAHALAKELNFEILEINASDFRDEQRLNQSAGHAAKQQSLFSRSKLILIDEVEGIFGRLDYGGLSALTKLIKQTSFPIIITANNPWDKKFTPIRTACEMIQFNKLRYTTIQSLLKKICADEKIDYEPKAIEALARRAGGDARGAITDLQTLTTNKSFTYSDLELLSNRSKKESILQALVKVFKTTDPSIALNAFDNIEEQTDEIFLWLDENLPKEYTKPADLSKAYETLSRADIFRRRIIRRQHWRFLVYIHALMSAGIAISKEEKYSRFIPYTRTKRILKLWQAKQKNQKRKAIAEKLAEKLHCSARTATQSILPYLKFIMKKSKNNEQYVSYFKLDNDELAWLTN